jgi:DNA-binding beta-propeller fold protein YncE
MNRHAGIMLGLVLSGAAWAQVGAPVLGYVPDGGRIRPVYGIPAAATVATPLDYGRNFSLIAISPLQNFALVTSADTGAVLLAASNGSTTSLPGAAPNPDRIVLSPGGSAAVLWFSSTSHLQIVSGLPNAPSIREADATFLSALLDDSSSADAPGALAVSDDGQWVAGSWSRGLYAFGPNGEVTRLPMRERAAALAFFAGRQDLALATELHVFSIADVGGRAAVSTLYAGDRLTPVGMALTSDNQRMVVAASSGTLLTLDLAAGSTSRFDCGCAPVGVFGMGRAAFRLTGLTGSFFKLFDASSSEVLFVPLAFVPQAGGQE